VIFCVQQPASAEAAGFCGELRISAGLPGDAVKWAKGTAATQQLRLCCHPHRTQIDSAL